MPTATGWINRSISTNRSRDTNILKLIAAMHITAADGNIQIRKVQTASRSPPIFQAMPIKVWVDDGPGNICDKAFSSISSCSSIYRRFSTNSRSSTAIWACGPPNDVIV